MARPGLKKDSLADSTTGRGEHRGKDRILTRGVLRRIGRGEEGLL